MEINKAIFYFLIGFCSGASARDLTWNQVVDLAQKNNLELQSSVLTYQSTQSLETQAQSGFYPHLSASASNSKSWEEELSYANGYSAQLNLTQNIFAGFADLNRSRQAKANTEQASANLNAEKAKVSSDLKVAAANYFYALDSQKLAAEIVRRRDDNLKNVDLRFQSGREDKGSVLLSQAYVNEARYEQMSADQLFETSSEDLKRILGLDRGDVVAITDGIPLATLDKTPPDFQKLSLQTPDVVALTAQEQAADYATDIAKSSFVPSLDLSGSYGYADTKFFPQQDRWSVGITLSVPLFDGGRDYSSVKSASYHYQSLNRQKNDLLQKKIVTLKSAYYDFLMAIEKEKLDDSFRQAAVVRAQIERSKYNNGLTTFDEWDRAESDSITRQRSYLSSRQDRIVKQAAWEQAQGVGVFQ